VICIFGAICTTITHTFAVLNSQLVMYNQNVIIACFLKCYCKHNVARAQVNVSYCSKNHYILFGKKMICNTTSYDRVLNYMLICSGENQFRVNICVYETKQVLSLYHHDAFVSFTTGKLIRGS